MQFNFFWRRNYSFTKEIGNWFSLLKETFLEELNRIKIGSHMFSIRKK